MFKTLFNVVCVTVVAAVLFVGCGGDDNPTVDTSSDIVGDWIVYSEGGEIVDTSMGKLFLTFKSSGEFVFTTFGRVSDYYDFSELVNDVITTQVPTRKNGFWMESKLNSMRMLGVEPFYKIENGKILFRVDGYFGGYFTEYTMSGNKLTLDFGGGGDEIVLYKSHISSARKTLGTVYVLDSALEGGYGWLNTDGEEEYWDFDYGYTVGSRLFVFKEVLDIDCGGYCDLPIMMTTKFDYNISTVNGVKILTTRIVGPLGILGPPVEWVYSDYDYYYSQAKSRQDKKANGYGKNRLYSFMTRPIGAR